MKLPKIPHVGLIAGGAGALGLAYLWYRQQQTAAIADAAGQAATGQPNYPLFQSAALPAGTSGAASGTATSGGTTSPAGLTTANVTDLFKTLLTGQAAQDLTAAGTATNQLSSSVGDHLFAQLNAIDGSGILGGGTISGNVLVNQGLTSFNYSVAPHIVTPPPAPIAPVNPAPTTVQHKGVPYIGYTDNVTGAPLTAAYVNNDPVLAMMSGAVSNATLVPWNTAA
jgi:hypothetical protein